MTTIATLCTGFDGVGVGARAAGFELAWGIEYEAAIAEVANANLGKHVIVANLLDCDPFGFEAVDVLHASPPCPSFSVANANGGETAIDIALGKKVAEFVTILKPQIFTLENVYAYRYSRSWLAIEDALHATGYWVSVEHCNFADYGVPQTRKRMIVRAVRGGFVPYLPEPQPWIGWYAAIEDLIDTLPPSKFADWQLARLPELQRSFLVQVQGEAGDGVRWDTEPMQTVTSNHGVGKYRGFLVGDQERQFAGDNEPAMTVRAYSGGGAMPRAFLMDGQNASAVTIRDGERRSFTITNQGKGIARAYLVPGGGERFPTPCDSEPAFTITGSQAKGGCRALFDCGRVVAMTPRALARFQSFPDTYELPDNARLAAKGIGNAVPPLAYQRIIGGLVAR